MNQALRNKLLAVCQKYTSPDGKLTLYMNPIKSVRHDWVANELDRVRPRVKWQHEDTGTIQFSMPEAVALEIQRQRRMNDADQLPTGWVETYLWSDLESAFVVMESYVVHIEFGANLTLEQERLRTYWDERTNVIADDFALFEHVFAADLSSLLWSAYSSTRPKQHAAPAVLSDPQADPKNPTADPEK